MLPLSLTVEVQARHRLEHRELQTRYSRAPQHCGSERALPLDPEAPWRWQEGPRPRGC